MFDYIINKEDVNCEIVLELIPQSPLSISRYKGTVNKTMVKPSNHNILGLVENILGIHFSLKMRKEIIKKYKINYTDRMDGRLFVSLLEDKVIIESIKNPNVVECFMDSYAYLNKRVGEDPHIKGIKNCDVSLQHHKKTTLTNLTGTSESKDMLKASENFPTYYTSLYNKEWVITEGSYFIRLKTTESIKKELIEKLEENNSYYLGNNESIISVKILAL